MSEPYIQIALLLPHASMHGVLHCQSTEKQPTLEAEKVYGADNYEAKLAYIEKFIEKHNFNLKSFKLKEMVDAAIQKMERAEAIVVENKEE